jgi:hypothetical protein
MLLELLAARHSRIKKVDKVEMPLTACDGMLSNSMSHRSGSGDDSWEAKFRVLEADDFGRSSFLEIFLLVGIGL